VGAVIQRQLGAGDGSDAGRARRPREFHRAMESIVIGDRQRSVAEIGGLPDDLLRQRRAIEEGERGVEVELDVGGVAR
jgi:hypothetical protein